MNTKTKSLNRVVALILVTIMLLSTMLMVFSQILHASTTIRINDSSPSTGDTIRVEISASPSSDFEVAYTDSILRPTSSSGSRSGNTISFNGSSATIEFQVIAPGTANIIVRSDNAGGSSAQVVATGTAIETTDTDDEDEEDELDNSTSSTSEDDIVLTSESDYEITIKDATELKEPYSIPKTITFGDEDIDVYSAPGDNRFYMVYAVDGSGDEGWYQIDVETGIISKLNDVLLEYKGSTSVGASDEEEDSEEANETEEKSGFSIREFFAAADSTVYIIIGIIVAFLIVFIILVNIIIANVQKSDGHEPEDIELNNNDEDIKIVKTVDKKAKRKAERQAKKEAKEKVELSEIEINGGSDEKVDDKVKLNEEPKIKLDFSSYSNDDSTDNNESSLFTKSDVNESLDINSSDDIEKKLKSEIDLNRQEETTEPIDDGLSESLEESADNIFRSVKEDNSEIKMPELKKPQMNVEKTIDIIDLNDL